MVTDQQTKVTVDTADAHAFVRNLAAALRLKGQCFNVCFVDDIKIQRLNAEFRGRPKATDVLSFPWKDSGPPQFGVASGRKGKEGRWRDEFAGFVGDVVISAETAGRNAVSAGHSTLHEIRWLILHGVLHLLGYDHETDDGEMTRLELSLRGRLRIDGLKGKGQKAKTGVRSRKSGVRRTTRDHGE